MAVISDPPFAALQLDTSPSTPKDRLNFLFSTLLDLTGLPARQQLAGAPLRDPFRCLIGFAGDVQRKWMLHWLGGQSQLITLVVDAVERDHIFMGEAMQRVDAFFEQPATMHTRITWTGILELLSCLSQPDTEQISSAAQDVEGSRLSGEEKWISQR